MNRQATRYYSAFLLMVFLSVLTARSVHQLKNPVAPSMKCEVSQEHFHQGIFGHCCELCDYQVTTWQPTFEKGAYGLLVKQEPPGFLPTAPHVKKPHHSPHRGPPQVPHS